MPSALGGAAPTFAQFGWNSEAESEKGAQVKRDMTEIRIGTDRASGGIDGVARGKRNGPDGPTLRKLKGGGAAKPIPAKLTEFMRQHGRLLRPVE
jgi:hypothetical protein